MLSALQRPLLRSFSKASWRCLSTATTPPRTALFFPGQGVQRVGMLDPWLSAFPNTVRPILDEVDSLLDCPLTRIIADGPNSLLTATENAQPAILATSIVILRVLETDYGFSPAKRVDVTLGHSLGEFAALVAGGYLQHADALRLVRRRAESMAACSREAVQKGGGEYGMVALVCEPGHLPSLIEAIHDFLGHASAGSKQDSAETVPPIEQVLIANINAKNQIVLSGNIERIRTLLTHLRQFGGHDPRAVRLKSDSPFHSPLMAPARDLMSQLLSEPSSSSSSSSSSAITTTTTTSDGKNDIVTFPGLMPCVSNVSARPFESRAQLKDLLARQCVETVRWWDSIRYLDQDERVRRWIGIGPGQVGRNLVGKEVGMRGRQGAVKGGGVWGISDPREVDEIMRALEFTQDKGEDD
ncbi:MAG: hypothetical protein M1825_000824 [Sarcosagium campestre]|nr:MAG: hypothetical protein M1825_000824 [Sarcosagium campestre]